MEGSVIIPCHNGAQWVGAAVQSALEQTSVCVEVIVVDDGSTDGSVEVIKGFGDRVTLIRGDWKNGNGARNAGLAAARGKWIQFLDADDFLKPDKITKQLTAATPDTEMIYSPLIVREEKKGGEVLETLSVPTQGADLIEQWLRWELCQTGAALWRAPETAPNPALFGHLRRQHAEREHAGGCERVGLSPC